MTTPLIRLTSAWNRHGPLQFFRLVAKNLWYVPRSIFRRPEPQDSAFDYDCGTETAGIREIGSLGIESANARHAVRYEPSPSALARAAIHSLGIPSEEFTFIDFGSGKGRVLLIAAEMGFARVVGIEFSQELCDVAKNNMTVWRKAKGLTVDFSCVCADVTEFVPPDSRLICYLYNPFSAHVMSTVEKHLSDSVRACPRDVYVVYVHPKHEHVFEQSGRWSILRKEDAYTIYKASVVSS